MISNLKIVEVRGDADRSGRPMLHMANPECHHIRITGCGMRYQNCTGIHVNHWGHSDGEYSWCRDCQTKVSRMSKTWCGVARDQLPWAQRKAG